MEGITSEPTAKTIEGKIVAARKLKNYARFLHFDPNILTNQKVLNFGSGGSNIGKELNKKQIPCDVIDVDLQVIGTGIFFAGLKTLEKFSYIDDKSMLGRKLSDLHRKSSERNRKFFVQADGRSLPFKDKQFDTVLALWSTYQVPYKDKERVFRELMRVGNAIHCGPIAQKDFEVWDNLCKENGFDIVACRPFSERGVFTAINLDDYQAYRDKYPQEERIKIPQSDSPKMYDLFGKPILVHVLMDNYIVLKRILQ